MTQNNIINSWSLFAFAQQFGGNLAVGECTDHNTGEMFKACTFTKDGKRTFVSFGKSLAGGLSLQEIVQQRDNLQVVQLTVEESVLTARQAAGKQLESYALCKKGETSWESINILGLF